MARTAGLRILTLVLQGWPEIQAVNFRGSMGNSFQMGLWNPQNEKHRWRRFPYLKKKQHHHHHYQHHHHKHRPSKDFQHLQQNTNDESDTDTSANDFDSSDSDDEVCTWPP